MPGGRSAWESALIGIGANIGEPLVSMAAAVRMIARERDLVVRRLSPVYRTSPVGRRRQPWFRNAAVLVSTRLSSRRLLGRLLRMEKKLGRGRHATGEPRVIDLDLLLRGRDVMACRGAVVPHPRMHERAFVLVPCSDVAGDMEHPALEMDIRSLLAGLETGETVRRMPGPVQRRFRRMAGLGKV